MRQLLYKDFRLTAHPIMYAFGGLTAMLLIPSYPYYVVFFYACLGIFFTFINGREARDVDYTALLPVRKRDVVSARCVMMVLVQIAYVALSVPFALLNRHFNPSGNQAGIEANAAFFGLSFLMMGIFNQIFLAEFYRDAYRAGRAFVLACAAISAFMLLCETSVHAIPWVKSHLDNFDMAHLPLRLGILGAGIALYSGLTLWGKNIASRRFERAEL